MAEEPPLRPRSASRPPPRPPRAAQGGALTTPCCWWQVLAQAEAAAEAKRAELRALVGASYRDVIDSADLVMDMAKHGQLVMECLGRGEAALKVLAEGGGGYEEEATGPEAAAEAEAERLFELGGRIKYLIDTPETIWSFLDDRSYPGAVGRALQAEHVHRSLRAGYSGEMRALFPLVGHHWPEVQAMQGQIIQHVMAFLGKAGELSGQDAADSLMALAYLRGVSTGELLQLFLEKRLDWVKLELSRLNRGEGADALLASLVRLGKGVQSCVLSTFALFVDPVSGGGLPLVDAATSIRAVQGFRVRAPSPPKRLSAKTFWAGLEQQCLARLSPLPVQDSLQIINEWLQELESCFLGSEGMFARLGSADQLSALETALRQGLHPAPDEAAGIARLHIKLAAYQSLCKSVMEDDLGVWALCFDAPVIARGKAIVGRTLRSLVTDGAARLAEVIEEASELPVEAGSRGSVPWQARYRTHVATRGRGLERGGAGETAGDPGAPWYSGLKAIMATVEASLVRGLRDAVRIMTNQRSPALLLKRVGELEKFLAAESCNAVRELVGGAVAAAGARGGPDRNSSELAILVGQLCMLLRPACNPALDIILGSPAAWTEKLDDYFGEGTLRPLGEASGRRRSRSGSAARAGQEAVFSSVPSKQLAPIVAHLERVGLAHYEKWIASVCGDLAGYLEDRLCRTVQSFGRTVPGGWDTTEVGEAGQEDHMQFALPASCSPGLAATLYAACRDVQRANGHVLDEAILREFRGNLLTAVVGVYRRVVLTEGLGESCVLQFLFDLNFVADLLCKRPAHGAAKEKQLAREAAKVQGKFAALLDPIDWATYEPHLLKKEDACVEKVGVLMGPLIRLFGPQKRTEKPQGSGSTSAMEFACNAGRFGYLPISAPGTLARNQELHLESFQVMSDGAESSGRHGVMSFVEQRGGLLGSMIGEGAAGVTAFAQDFASSNPFNTMFSQLTKPG